ncbi:MAG: sensor histidine kinase, partial [bacterium]
MRPLHRLFFRNFMTTVVVLLVAFALLATVFAAASYTYVISEKTHDMGDYAQSVVGMVNTFYGIYDLDNVNIRAFITLCAESSRFQILITDEEGVIVSTSDRSGYALGETVPRGAVTAIINGGEYRALTTLGGLYTREHYVVGLPLAQNGSDHSFQGYLFVAGRAGEMSALWRSFYLIFAVVAGLVILISFIVVYLTSKRQSRPLTEMAEAARNFERGDFSQRVTETGRKDELGELAHAFNKMADSLERGEAARRDLIANVSHELKTPMTTITGFADGILDGTIPPEREREYLSIISSETKRLSRLVRGMLDMNRLQSDEQQEKTRESFDLSEVVCQALVSLEGKITSRGLDVEADLPEESVMALGDRDSITQVVYNLIDNAAKF